MIYSVIDSSYGDTGIGLITDYLCDRLTTNTLNIKHSGGSDSRHKIATRDGSNHIARHVGSGCLTGVPTYLSEYFICDPQIFCKEINEFVKPFIPIVYVSPNAICSSPYDSLLDQMIDKDSNDCIGIHETIERNKNPKYGFKVSLILQDHPNWKDLVLRKLSDIRMEWANHRLLKNNLEYLMPEFRHKVYDLMPRMDSEFIDACTIFRRYAKLTDVNILRGYDNLVFEGSQGLMLDENMGSKNVVSLLQQTGLDQELLNTIYTTKWYVSSNSKKSLEHELSGNPSVNIENNKQELLKYAWLNMDILADVIDRDLQRYVLDIVPHRYHLAVTCLDQANEFITYYNNKQSHIARVDTFIDVLTKKLDTLDLYLSHGSTRQEVTKIQ